MLEMHKIYIFVWCDIYKFGNVVSSINLFTIELRFQVKLKHWSLFFG